VITGHPALLTLARLKLRGTLRRQLRKVRSPSGLLFALVGGLISVGWIGSLLIGRAAFQGDPPAPEVVRDWTQFGMAVLVFMSLLSAVSLRGVYLPKQDIERLFAAPVSRQDLVRFRMIVDAGRALFGALVIALLTFHRMPVPLYGFVGVMLAVLTLGILRQTFSLLLGSAHNRLGAFLEGRSLTFVRVVLALLIWLLIMGGVLGADFAQRFLGDLAVLDRGTELVGHPLAQKLLLPFRPWAMMTTAEGALDFALWGGACLALGVLLFEVTARLPVDYREHSLETSDKIARRISQVRRGGIFTGGKASRRTAHWRLPWLFGRSAMGAVAWVKLVSMVRKARGTLFMGLLIVTLVTVFVTIIFGLDESFTEAELAASSGLIGFLGIVYLSGTLRFDFRADLDRMVQVKAWPLGPRRIFVATLLPEVVLISGLLGLAIAGRLLFLGSFSPRVLLVTAVLPLFTYAWLAVDNAVYLFAPVRFVPGQEGSLHHTGRALVLVFLRMLLAGLGLALVGAATLAIFTIGPEVLGLSEEQAGWLSAGIGLAVLLGQCGLLTWIGGRMMQRFDVARDTG